MPLSECKERAWLYAVYNHALIDCYGRLAEKRNLNAETKRALDQLRAALSAYRHHVQAHRCSILTVAELKAIPRFRKAS